MAKRIHIKQWPLGRPQLGVEGRFRRRTERYGALVVVPRHQLEQLIERAETVSHQLSLPFRFKRTK